MFCQINFYLKIQYVIEKSGSAAVTFLQHSPREATHLFDFFINYSLN